MHAPESFPFKAAAADAGTSLAGRKSTTQAPAGPTELDHHQGSANEPAQGADDPERWDGLA